MGEDGNRDAKTDGQFAVLASGRMAFGCVKLDDVVRISMEYNLVSPIQQGDQIAFSNADLCKIKTVLVMIGHQRLQNALMRCHRKLGTGNSTVMAWPESASKQSVFLRIAREFEET